MPLPRSSKQFREDMKLLSDPALQIALETIHNIAPFDLERQEKYSNIIRQEQKSRQQTKKKKRKK